MPRRTKDAGRFGSRSARLLRHTNEVVDIRTVKQLREELAGYSLISLTDQTQNFHKYEITFHRGMQVTITTLKGSMYDELLFLMKD